MGIETSVIYRCDVGGETTTDATGWLNFRLVSEPLVMSANAEASMNVATLVCPEHYAEVMQVISAGLASLFPAPPVALLRYLSDQPDTLKR